MIALQICAQPVDSLPQAPTPTKTTQAGTTQAGTTQAGATQAGTTQAGATPAQGGLGPLLEPWLLALLSGPADSVAREAAAHLHGKELLQVDPEAADASLAPFLRAPASYAAQHTPASYAAQHTPASYAAQHASHLAGGASLDSELKPELKSELYTEQQSELYAELQSSPLLPASALLVKEHLLRGSTAASQIVRSVAEHGLTLLGARLLYLDTQLGSSAQL